MNVEIDYLTNMVMKLLDENPDFIRQRMQYNEPDSPLENLIESLLPLIAEGVILEAAAADIDEYEDFDAEVEWTAPGEGSVRLPHDFLRFVCFRMSDWTRRLTSTLDPDSEDYMLYSARKYPGKPGRRRHPAAVIFPDSEGGTLEFFGSTDPGAYPVNAGYIPKPATENDDTLKIPRSLVGRVVEKTAERIKKIRS